MSFEKAEKYLNSNGFGDRIHIFNESSATVELAAAALGCEESRIAKSLTFTVNDAPIMIIAAGDVKIDNPKYKAYFGTKAKMLTAEQVEEQIGHKVGGVCPFGINEGVTVYLDESLYRFDFVYPACGSSNSAVKLTVPELEKLSGFKCRIDVCKSK